MAYVQRSDYSRIISNEDLRDLLEEANEYFLGKSEEQVLNEAGAFAEGRINMYLSTVYQMDTEFAKDATADPDTRETNVLHCYLTIAVYNLHFVINPRDIPELRQAAYDSCMDMLQKVRDRELVIDVPEQEGATRFQMSGAVKFISKPFRDPLVYNNNQILP